jgi:hypothetical protein
MIKQLTNEDIIRKLNKVKLDIKTLNKIHNIIDNTTITKIDIPTKSNIDTTTDKYKTLLKFVNGILFNIDKKTIEDLTEFIDIDRLDIINDKNKQLLDNMSTKLFKCFPKVKATYKRKGKSLILNCLRGFCKQIGLKLINKHLSRTINCKVQSYYYYSIKNI